MAVVTFCASCGEAPAEVGDLCRVCDAEHSRDFIDWLDAMAERELERRGDSTTPLHNPPSARGGQEH